jgi:RNA recognition motif-containing protein
MKIFDGKAIEVQVGSGSTLYVCNFPPTADEAWVREKFQKVGSSTVFALVQKLTNRSMERLSMYDSRR